MSPDPAGFTCMAAAGLDEIRPGDDLGGLLSQQVPLADGDILVVTSKVVSKAEGRVVSADRASALAGETDRVVARRGETLIVRTTHGLVMAAAGIDASNTEPGTVVLLPADPDGSARALRERIGADGGPNVAVVVSDTVGRAWRNGQTDIAIGAAGLEVILDHAGLPDGYGNVLEVTAPAVADEVAAAADLVKGKVGRAPAAVLRGLGHLVCPRGDHGSGAGALIRDESLDMFGLGAREAVLHAVQGDAAGLRGFGSPAPVRELTAALRQSCPAAKVHVAQDGRVDVRVAGANGNAAQRALGGDEARLVAVAFAMGWTPTPEVAQGTGTDVLLGFRAATP